MGEGLFCTNQAFSVSRSRDVTIKKNIRAVTAGSTAICQILMSEVHAVRETNNLIFT